MIEVNRTSPASLNGSCFIATWEGLQLGDDGQPIELPMFSDRSVQVTGVFGAAGSVRIEGSIDGTNYAPLTDAQGNELDISAAKIEAITELVRYVRPRVIAGDGTTLLNVAMLLKGKS